MFKDQLLYPLCFTFWFFRTSVLKMINDLELMDQNAFKNILKSRFSDLMKQLKFH